MSILLLLILVLLIIGGVPQMGFHQYGYAPSGLATVLLIVVLVMLLTGRL